MKAFINNLNNNLLQQRLVYFFMILCSLVFVVASQEQQAWLFITFSIVAIVLAACNVSDQYLRRFLLFAFLLRFVLALVQTYTAINLPGAGADTVVFELYAWEYATALHQADGAYTLGEAYYYYSALIGLFYYYFGRMELIAQMVNISFGLLIIFYTYRITIELTGNVKSARISALIVSFFPTLVFYSAVLHREIIIIFAVLYSYYLLLLWIQQGKLYLMFLSLMALAAASLFHGALIILGMVHLLLLFFVKPVEQRFYVSYKQVAVVAFLLMLTVYFSSEYIVYKLPGSPLDMLRLEHFQQYVGNRNFGRTHYLVGFIPQSYFDLFWHTPVRAFYFLFTPFPWMIENISDGMGLLDSITYIVLTCFGFIGFKMLYRKNKLALLSMVAIMLLVLVMYSWGTVNYGTAWRHRAKMAPYLIVLASVPITERIKSSRFSNII